MAPVGGACCKSQFAGWCSLRRVDRLAIPTRPSNSVQVDSCVPREMTAEESRSGIIDPGMQVTRTLAAGARANVQPTR